jgi:hypothetical protein
LGREQFRSGSGCLLDRRTRYSHQAGETSEARAGENQTISHAANFVKPRTVRDAPGAHFFIRVYSRLEDRTMSGHRRKKTIAVLVASAVTTMGYEGEKLGEGQMGSVG